MAKGAWEAAAWLGAAGLFVWASSGLLGGKRKSGLRVYKFPAKYPGEWDERTVELKVGRRYKLPLPQPEEGTYWTLMFSTEAMTRGHVQEIDKRGRAVGWDAGGGYTFKWIEATADLVETKITITLWSDEGYVQELHEVTVRRRKN